MEKKMMDNFQKERRSEDYHFYSLLELFEYFANVLSLEEMDTVVRESAKDIVLRQFETDEETRLRFVKKCESGMDALAQLKEGGVYTGLNDFNSEKGKRE